MVLGAVDVHAEKLVELGGGDDERRGVGESVDDRVREKVHQHAQPQDAQQELKDPHHEREQHGIGHVARTPLGGERRQRRGRHEGYDRHGTRGELMARAEQRADQRRQEGSIQAVVGGETGQLRVGHRLRNQDQRHRHARDTVGTQVPDAVVAEPPEERKDPMEHAGYGCHRLL